jgi:hypothetical protein
MTSRVVEHPGRLREPNRPIPDKLTQELIPATTPGTRGQDMTMKRWMTAVFAAAMTSAGCANSHVDPEVNVTLTGKVLKEDKQPLADALLTINRASNSECIFLLFDGVDWKKLKTGADGSFSMELLGADTQNGGTARCFEVHAPGSGKGDYLYAWFLMQSETVQVPVLQQWTGSPASVATADGVSVSFKPISDTQADASGEHTLSVTQKSSGALWMSTSVHSPVLLNDDLLEDANAEASLSLYRYELPGSNTHFNIFYQGAPVALPKRARVPVSRGASCTYAGAPATCPLTDGQLGGSTTFQEGVQEVVIQLPQPKVLRKAVLRNLALGYQPTAFVLEGSADGTQWVTLATLKGATTPAGEFIEQPLSNPTAVSQVRLRAPSSDAKEHIRTLNELSLFE